MKVAGFFTDVLLALATTVSLLLVFASVSYGQAKDDYQKEWDAVEKKESDGLPKSARDLVDAIYKKAKREKNAPQQVKALIHLVKYQAQIEDEGLVKAIQDFEKEISTAEFPVKPLLYSLIADFYWQYYQNHRYTFLNRTPGAKLDEKDISTWDLETLVSRITAMHRAALSDADKLKSTPLTVYDAILDDATDSKKYRPTFFDFLAHRTLAFYQNEERGLTKPQNEFELSTFDAFSSAADFSKVKFQTEDSASLKFQALLVYQDLTRLHLLDKTPDALVDLDLFRLAYAKQISPAEVKGESENDAYIDALHALEEKYRAFDISTEVLYRLALYYNTVGDDTVKGTSKNPVPKNAALKNGKQTALALCETAIDRAPKSRGGINAQQLKLQLLAKRYSLNVEKTVAPDAPFRVSVSYANVGRVYYRLYKLDSDISTRTERRNENIDVILKQRVVASGAADLPLPQDYVEHTAELKMNALPRGHYAVIFSATESFARDANQLVMADFWSTALSLLSTGANYSYDDSDSELGGGGDLKVYRVLHAQTGKPLPDVVAQLFREVYDYKTSAYKIVKGERYATDRDGKFTVKNQREGYRIDLTQAVSADQYTVAEMFYTAAGKPNRDDIYKTVLFTDRSIYRPGQTIFFKGIALKSTYNSVKNDIVAGETVTVTFLDVNYQQIATTALTTSDYGTFHGSFTAPMGVLNGNMQIQVSFRGRSSANYVSIEEYKRPKFEVDFKPVTESYKLGDKVKLTGFAKSYAGANIDGADIKYRVMREAKFPFWWYWWRPYPSSPSREIAHGTLKSDAKGEFEIVFEALPDRSISEADKPEFTYTVSADVTDLNGETRSGTTSLRAGTIALNVTWDIPEAVSRDYEMAVGISTQNLNGQFEAAKGTLKLVKIEQGDRVFRQRLWKNPDQFTMKQDEFYALFPHDYYADEDIFNSETVRLPEKGILWQTAKDKEKATINLPVLESGKYLAVLETKDRYGKSVKLEKRFSIYSEKDARPALNKPFYFVPLPKPNGKLAGSYEPGETARVLWGSANKEMQAVYEVEVRGKIVKRETLTASRSQRVLEVPIAEEHRGGITVHLYGVLNNRFYYERHQLSVPWSNKELKVELSTFRNKLLPGQKEEWRLTLKGSKAEKVAAELVATLYDASLDAFRPHNWSLALYPAFYSRRNPTVGSVFSVVGGGAYAGSNWNPYSGSYSQGYDRLRDFGLYFYDYGRGGGYGSGSGGVMRSKKKDGAANGDGAEESMAPPAPPPPPASAKPTDGEMVITADRPLVEKESKAQGLSAGVAAEPTTAQGKADFSDVKARTNLNETAFFFPDLRTNENGDIVLSFTMPEALTKWKLMGLAHTPDLKTGTVTATTVTQKDLMVQPNAPRFFRETDAIEFPVKITNLTDKDLSGSARLFLFDASSMQPLDARFAPDGKPNGTLADQSFTVKAGQSAAALWKLKVPEGIGAVIYRVVAKAGDVSDGEEAPLPVLSDKLLVTESLPLPVRSNQTKTFEFKKLINSKQSTTLRNHRLTLEFTSNPAWYAVQALPYMIEFPHECAEQLFSRYYANSIAFHIANSSPKIKRVFDVWKTQQPGALLSNLEKNQELKQTMLEETPWVLDGKDESERKRRVAVLFEVSNMESSLSRSIRKLAQMQAPDGGFPWFAGMPSSHWITQHLVAGFGHLEKLNIKVRERNGEVAPLLQRAVQFADNEMRKDYEDILKYDRSPEDDHLSYIAVHYLYARSYYNEFPIETRNQKAFDYWKRQGEKYWTKQNIMLKGMLALAFHRMDEKVSKTGRATAQKIMRSVKEYAMTSEELGMYWKENVSGYYWYQAPIETQALMVECFDEVAKDQAAVEDIKVWLLKNKQVQDWKTTKATAEACYALLLRGTELLASDKLAEISLGGVKINPYDAPAGDTDKESAKVEAGTGYFKLAWTGSDIKPEMGEVTVKNPNAVVAWGALYWQYFERMDKITPAETPLKLKKQLYLQENTDKGPRLKEIKEGAELKVGDLVKVRIELRVDRDMEYIQMKDMRASGVEPVSVLSQCKYQDGLYYYESTRDAATHFFMDYLRKGTYVFEYAVRASHRGKFQNGITTIQSMYAPEFNSHSEGILLEIK